MDEVWVAQAVLFHSVLGRIVLQYFHATVYCTQYQLLGFLMLGVYSITENLQKMGRLNLYLVCQGWAGNYEL